LRLPRDLEQREVSLTRTIQIPEQGDAAIYARVTLEDGHVAWSSPIYAYRSDS
jgi:PhoPQ-activated pathogenicity-related protein